MFNLFSRRPPILAVSGRSAGIDLHMVHIASIDAQLRSLPPAAEWTAEQEAYANELLDNRMGCRRIRPAVPVIPGRGGEGGAR